MKQGPGIRLVLLLVAMALASPLPSLAGPLPVAKVPSTTLASTLSSPNSPLSAGVPQNQTLGAIGAWLGLDPLSGAAPIHSPLLGIDAPATELVRQYATRAQASPTPLRDALVAWNTALALQDSAQLLQDPQVRSADQLPLDLQRATATLLAALTDATLLQRHAISGLNAQQYRDILSVPLLAPEGGLNPATTAGQQALNRFHAAAIHVDTVSIAQGTQLITGAVQSTLPALRAWATRTDAVPATNPLETVQGFLAAHSPASVQSLDPIDRLKIAEDALRLGAHLAGIDALQAPPIPVPDARHPLAGAIADLLKVTATPWRQQEGGLLQADGLPLPMQQAAARIVMATATWERALLGSATGQGRPADAIAAQLGVLEAVRAGAPTLQAWGLVWAHSGQAMLPASAGSTGEALQRIVAAASGPEAGRVQAMLALARPGMPATAPQAHSPTHLVDEVLRLYRIRGIQVSPATARQLADGARALNPKVEQAAAGILAAENDALDRLSNLYASLTPADHALLATPVDLQTLLAGPVSLQDLQHLRSVYAVVDRVESAYLDGATGIASAVDAAVQSLDAAQAPASIPPKGGLLHLLGSIHLFASADAQTVPVPGGDNVPNACSSQQYQDCCQAQSPLSDCSNDVLFRDPLLATIVISGTGHTTFDAAHLAPQGSPASSLGDGRQILTLDLGGSDDYANNAGGARMAATQSDALGFQAQLLDAVAVAVALGGKDANGKEATDVFEPPQQGPTDGIQGAGVGGIGLLYARSGNDEFHAVRRAQGYGGPAPDCLVDCALPFGVGILVHGEGNALYDAREKAQGTGEGMHASTPGFTVPGIAESVPHTTSPVELFGGVGLLLQGRGDLPDGSGKAQFILPPDGAPHFGQGAARNGTGILVDAGGSNDYENGWQGRSEGVGVGALIDLGSGHDTYTRTPSDQFGDGKCWLSLRAPRGNSLDFSKGPNSPFYVNATAEAQQATATGIFIDTSTTAPCTIDPAAYIPDKPDPTVNDKNHDGWPDYLESVDPFNQGPWDTGSPDYPAGLPTVICAPPEPVPQPVLPPASPIQCASGGGLPYGSSYLVRIPGILAIGDAVAKRYPAADATHVGRDYELVLDLVGGNTYLNKMGGDPGIASAASQRTGLASVGIDLGASANTYLSNASCIQGCNSMLLDFGDGSMFDATGTPSLSEPIVAQGGCRTSGADHRDGESILFHAAGTARYVMDNIGPGSFAQGTAVSFGGGYNAAGTYCKAGILLDTGSGDTYIGPGQGRADTSLETGANNNAGGETALFLDLHGNDKFDPAFTQTTAQAQATSGAGSSATGVFVDQGGHNTYLGPGGKPDVSAAYNGRTVVHYGGATSIFIDQANPTDGFSHGDDGSLDLPGLGIRIGTKGPDTYDSPYALVLDPGGDNTYNDNAGGTLLRGPIASSQFGGFFVPSDITAANTGQNYPVAALLIDLGGSGVYHAPDIGALGQSIQPSGAPSINANSITAGGSINSESLIPLGGGVVAQGAGLLGTGMLVQEGPGHSVYQARGFSQGAGLLGNGILWKHDGTATFGPNTDTVADPVMDHGIVAWREFANGQWRIFSRASQGQVCQLTPSDELGPVGSFAFEGGHGKTSSTLVYSVYSARPTTSDTHGQTDNTQGRWVLRALTINNLDQACPSTNSIANWNVVTAALSNQIHPRIAKDYYVWEDDRGSLPNVCYRRRTDDTGAPAISDPKLDLSVAPHLACGQSPDIQSNPDASASTVVWEEGADGNRGISSIDLGSGSLSVLAPQVPGQDAAMPHASSSVIAWQARHTLPDGSWSPWDIVFNNLNSGITRSLPTSGVDAHPIGRYVIFRDEGSDSLQICDCADGGTQVTLLRSNAKSAAPDSSLNNQFAWSTTGTPPTDALPAGIPWESIQHGSLLAADNTPDSNVTNAPSSFLQGAAFGSGLGLLLDESGNDRFIAGDFSQGASFSVAGPSVGNVANSNIFPASLGAHGLLVALAGNDDFIANQFSQGAHFGALLTYLWATQPVAPVPQTSDLVQTTENLGLLLTGRGSDSYSANGASMGFGALGIGADVVGSSPGLGGEIKSIQQAVQKFLQDHKPPSIGGGGAEVSAIQSAIASVGILADLGGTDTYHNIWSSVANRDLAAPGNLLPCDQVPGALQTLCAGAPCSQVPDALAIIQQACTGATAPSDHFWIQNGMRGVGTACPAPADAIDCPGLAMIVVGGIGMDLGAFDRVDGVETPIVNQDTAVAVYAVNKDNIVVDASPGHRAQGNVQLEAVVTQTQSLLQVQNVEFYIDGQSVGYGIQDTQNPNLWVRPDFNTDTDATPDGPHTLTARAMLHPVAETTPLGFAESPQTSLPIDNLPRILDAQLTHSLFSPAPFDPTIDAGSTTLTYRLSNDYDPGPYGLTRIQVTGPSGFSLDLPQLLPQIPDSSPHLFQVPDQNLVSVSWDGTDGHAPVAGGVYTITIQAWDRLNGNQPDPNRLVTRSFPVRVMSTPPSNSCITIIQPATPPNPQPQCNGGFYLTRQGDPNGRAANSTTADLIFTNDAPTNIRAYHLFTNKPPSPQWTEIPLSPGQTKITLPLQDGDQQLIDATQLKDATQTRFLVLAEDIAGNLECQSGCQGIANTLYAAVLAKDSQSMPNGKDPDANAIIDLSRPKLTSVTLAVDGVAKNLGDAARVGPDSKVDLSFQVEKTSNQFLNIPPQALVTWTEFACGFEHTDTIPVSPTTTPGVFTASWGGAQWQAMVAHAFPVVPDCPDASGAWPQRRVTLVLDAVDASGNHVESPVSGQVLLDTTPPELGTPSVAYAGGRLFWQPGDKDVVVAIQAKDAPIPHEVPVLNSELTVDVKPSPGLVTANDLQAAAAAAAAQTDPCNPTPDPTPLPLVPCYDAFQDAFLVHVPVPADTPPQIQPIPLYFTVKDPVGNAVDGSVPILVGAPNVGINESPPQLEVGGAQLSFMTTQDATAVLMYGLDSGSLKATDPTPLGHFHSFHLQGLTPGAIYYYQLIATDTQGRQETSPPQQVSPLVLESFRTLYGVHVAFLNPAPSQGQVILAGATPLNVSATIASLPCTLAHAEASNDPCAEPFVTVSLVPSCPSVATCTPVPIPVFQGKALGGNVGQDLVTDGGSVPDGLYSLTAQAVYDGETATTTLANVLVDNTPPTVSILSPAPDAILPRFPTHILLHLHDEGSGFTTGNLILTVNGTTVPTQAFFVPADGPNDGELAVTLGTGLPTRGPATLTAQVHDRAGNAASTVVRIFVDPNAPAITSAVLIYPPGQEAARDGQPVRLLATLTDAGGIASATADLSALRGESARTLQAGPLGYSTDLVVPNNLASGGIPIPVKATNLAGLESTNEAVLLIDNGSPSILSAVATPISLQEARLDLSANEPVHATASVFEGDKLVGHGDSSPTFQETTSLDLPGLNAGHVYRVQLLAVNRALNPSWQNITVQFAPIVAPPRPVTGLVAHTGLSGIRLQWDPQTPVGAFRYAVFAASGGPFHSLGQTEMNTFTDHQAVVGRSTQYFVQAINLAGTAGAPSLTVTITPLASLALDTAVWPHIGIGGQTPFRFQAMVRNATQQAPHAWLLVGNERTAMDLVEGDCRSTCTFAKTRTLPSLDLRNPEVRYAVELLDGQNLLRAPQEGTLVGPDVVQPAEPLPHGLLAPSVGPMLGLALLALAALRRRSIP